MPVYEYACDHCGERFELFVRSVAQQKAPMCPKCGEASVHKSISLFGVGAGAVGSAGTDASCGPGPV